MFECGLERAIARVIESGPSPFSPNSLQIESSTLDLHDIHE